MIAKVCLVSEKFFLKVRFLTLQLCKMADMESHPFAFETGQILSLWVQKRGFKALVLICFFLFLIIVAK